MAHLLLATVTVIFSRLRSLPIHSFGGEVEASNTPTIRRLTLHAVTAQLPADASISRLPLLFSSRLSRDTTGSIEEPGVRGGAAEQEGGLVLISSS